MERGRRAMVGAVGVLAVVGVVAVVLTGRPAAPATPDDSPRARVLSCDATFRVSAADTLVGYCATHPLDTLHPGIRTLVVVVHGDGRNADEYAGTLANATDPHTVAVIAPHFETRRDLAARSADGRWLHWSDDGWKEGAASRDASRVSSFTVLDEMLERVASGDAFPDLARVVLMGHSAGGQFVQRYLLASAQPERLNGVTVSGIVANPSSYTYLDERRFATDGTFRAPDGRERRRCPGYDDYKYGLESPNAYLAGSNRDSAARYGARDVTYVLGTDDTDPKGTNLDRSCAADLQGPHRFERGLRFFASLGNVLGPDVYARHRLVLVNGIGHDGQRILSDGQVLRLIERN